MTYEIKNCYIIECDGCKKGIENLDYTPHFDTPGEAVEMAEDGEWRCSGGHHWCPDCVPPGCGNCNHPYHGRIFGHDDEACEWDGPDGGEDECPCVEYSPQPVKA